MDRWAARTGQPVTNIMFWAMAWTGAGRYVPTTGKVDPSRLSEAAKSKLTYGQVRGTYKLDQCRDWLSTLVVDRFFMDGFLVRALIDGISDYLEERSENYGKHIKQTREEVESIDLILADDEAKARILDTMESVRGKRATDLDLLEVREMIAKHGVPSLSEQRERRQAIDVWHEESQDLRERCRVEVFGPQTKSRMEQLETDLGDVG